MNNRHSRVGGNPSPLISSPLRRPLNNRHSRVGGNPSPLISSPLRERIKVRGPSTRQPWIHGNCADTRAECQPTQPDSPSPQNVNEAQEKRAPALRRPLPHQNSVQVMPDYQRRTMPEFHPPQRIQLHPAPPPHWKEKTDSPGPWLQINWSFPKKNAGL